MKQAILIISTIITTSFSFACECRITEFSKEVNYAERIFIGKVINKNITGINAYYLFSVSKTFKGKNIDTLSITTGLGGPDCGMVFQVGKTYLVYSHNNQTTRCQRNALADDNPDIVKLNYLFNSYFSSNIGKTDNSILTNNEAEYFNAEFSKERKDFNFQGKNVVFVLNDSFINKQQYFKNWGGKEVVGNLIILSNDEKQQTGGYDVIIVLWRKKNIRKNFRKRLIKRLNNNTLFLEYSKKTVFLP